MPKILFLGANAHNTTRLRVAPEVRDVTEAITRTGAHDAFPVTALFAVRPEDLQLSLQRHQPDILHFSGHGTSRNTREHAPSRPGTRDLLVDEPEAPEAQYALTGGGIVLEDTNGAAVTVQPEALTRLLAILRGHTPIRCVVLNACFSAQQARGIAEHIDAVIGMKRAIDDAAAVAFAVGFYQALATGQSLQAAFDLGCNEIALRGLPDADVPELIVARSGVKPEDIVLADPPSSEIRSPSLRLRIRRAAPFAGTLTGLLLLALLFLPLTSVRVAPPKSGAIVVAGPWLTSARSREARKALCAALDDDAVRQEHEPRVDCIARALAHASDERLRQQAIAAGASLLVIVSSDGHARLLPLGQLAANSLFAERLPRVDLTRAEAPEELSPLLRSIARIADLGRDIGPGQRRCPAINMRSPPSLIALSLFVNAVSPNCGLPEERALAHLREVCDRDASSDVCGFIDELYPRLDANCEGKGRDAQAPLTEQAEQLVAHACLERASNACRAAIPLLGMPEANASSIGPSLSGAGRMAQSLACAPQTCVRLPASVIASCLLTMPGATTSADQVWLGEAEQLADGEADCKDANLRARVLGERAWWRARRENWSGAADDYDRAAQTLSDPIYTLNRVEVLLREGQPRSETEARMLLADPQVRIDLSGPEDVHHALLNWVLQRRSPSATLTSIKTAESTVLDRYERRIGDEEKVFDDPNDTVLRPLICRKGLSTCALDALAAPKSSGSRSQLERALKDVTDAERSEKH